MRLIRFLLLSFALTSTCFSALTAHAGAVVPSLTGNFQSQGWVGLLFHNEDNSWIAGSWVSPFPFFGNFGYYYDTYCSSGPCNVSWTGDMKGMIVQFGLTDFFSGVVISGQYADQIISDGVLFSISRESASWDFAGTWVSTGWTGEGSMSSYYQNVCNPVCGLDPWYFSGDIVTATPEPCSFVLICTGMLVTAGAIRRRVFV
jgi:hypothetical protein